MTLLDNILDDIKGIDGRQTKRYRDLAKSYKTKINALPLETVYELCDSLLKHKTWAETIIAYQIIFDQKKRYNQSTFDVFEKWLYNYIDDWWDCDDFMTHAFQYVLMQYPKNIDRLENWVIHERFAVRRSAAVILIVPAKKHLISINQISKICDLLMDDPHYLVQKGYGWLLKESTKHYHDEVVEYLKTNVSNMSRTAFRYALEKLPKEEKTALMQL